MQQNNLAYKKVVDRFSGYADFYHKYRPEPPEIIFETLSILSKESKDSTIVDLGCGTGLSTKPWSKYAKKVIGIDPSDDMINVARQNINETNISFQKGYGHSMNIDSATIDVLASSHAIHWMDPEPTFNEISRVLKPNGIFAAYGPQVPFLPLESYEVAIAFNEFNNLVNKIETEDQKNLKPKSWKWNEINAYIKQSGIFSYCDEICFHKSIEWDADTYCNWILTFSNVNALIRNNEEISERFLRLADLVKQKFGPGEKKCHLSYRMLLGIKNNI